MNYEINLDLLIQNNFIDIKELSKMKCLNKYFNNSIKIDKLKKYKYYMDRDIKFLENYSKYTLIYYRYNTKYKSIFIIFENGKIRSIKELPISNFNFVNISIINYVCDNTINKIKKSFKYETNLKLNINKIFINPWC